MIDCAAVFLRANARRRFQPLAEAPKRVRLHTDRNQALGESSSARAKAVLVLLIETEEKLAKS